MNRRMFMVWGVIFFAFISAGHNLNAQQNEYPIIFQLKETLESGNSGELAKHLYSRVTIKEGQERKQYSNYQARVKFKGFFEKYPPTNVKIEHLGDSGDIFYAIIAYRSNGIRFSMTVRGRNFGNSDDKETLNRIYQFEIRRVL